MLSERLFQAGLIRDLKRKYPGAVILKNDANHIQGIPDWTILLGRRWATFEVKKSEFSHRQPNQEHWVEKLDRMSFSRFVYPENVEEFLHDLQQSLKSRG